LSTLRNEQGKDILAFLEEQARLAAADGGEHWTDPPVLLTGDFNAEPTEPVYETLTESSGAIRLRSAYSADGTSSSEPAYTTWKVREDGEHVQTLDYIFSSSGLRAESVLDFPSGEDIGEGRLPSEAFASDHLSLIANFRLAENEQGRNRK